MFFWRGMNNFNFPPVKKINNYQIPCLYIILFSLHHHRILCTTSANSFLRHIITEFSAHRLEGGLKKAYSDFIPNTRPASDAFRFNGLYCGVKRRYSDMNRPALNLDKMRCFRYKVLYSLPPSLPPSH